MDIIDPKVVAAAAQGLALAIGKVIGDAGINLLGSSGGKLLDGAGKLTQAGQDLLRPISRKYIANYTDRHGNLKVLGMGKPVSLDSVYTKVNFQSDTIRCYQSLEAQEKVFRQREFGDDKKRPGLDVANQEQYLMVLGHPGTGKTTFLRKVGLEALKGKAKGEYQHTCIPVLLELRKFNRPQKKIDLVRAIASEFENCGLPRYQECTQEFLTKGKLLILLDGLDEIPKEQMSEMTAQIRDLLDRYSDNRFIVSCRIAAYRNFYNFQRFTDVAIAEFDDEQIKTFIGKWFESHSQSEWGQQCWEKLNSGDHKATKELTRTPLLLTLICILFRKRGEFPNKRATVYNEALWTLLSEWDASKEIIRSTPYQGMDTKCKEIMLAEIAYDNFVANNLFFQQVEISQQIQEILGEMLPEEKFIDGRAVLRAIEEQHGVLVSRADNIYSFSHLTLQEFLTAKHIVDNNLDIKELVTNHLCDRRWLEVFLILSGLRRADDLLLEMEETIHSLLDTPKLRNLLAWVEHMTNTTAGDFQPVGKRAIAFANILANTFANANTYSYINVSTYNYASTLAYTAHALADAISIHSTKVSTSALTDAYVNVNHLVTNTLTSLNHFLLIHPDADADPEEYDYAIDKFINYVQESERFQIYKNVDFTKIIVTFKQLKQQILSYTEQTYAFGERIIQTWLEAFHLTPEMVDLSKSELKALDNYFYCNWLMVECKNGAVRVSPKTWEKIESRMLLPVENTR